MLFRMLLRSDSQHQQSDICLSTRIIYIIIEHSDTKLKSSLCHSLSNIQML